MKRTMAAVLILSLTMLALAGCSSADTGPRGESGIVGEWESGGLRIVYEADGTVTDFVDGEVASEGTYDVEQSGGQWVEVYTNDAGETSRYFFTASETELMIYETAEDAAAGTGALAKYTRVK